MMIKRFHSDFFILIPFILFIPSTLSPATLDAAEPAKFELVDGDRVVFLGNTLIEREQKYGYWELMLTMAWPERNVTFRNLGWSGDTVWGESRAGFGTQADGFKALVEQVNAAQPTVIFVGYGNVEAFDGETGLPRFVEGFNKLLDELEKTKARIVVLGPINADTRVPGNDYEKSVFLYSSMMKRIAAERRHWFVDFAHPQTTMPETTGQLFRSMNGVDRTLFGYVVLSSELSAALSLPTPPASRDLEMQLTSSDTARIPPILHAIIKKNELFFHRWRPQNETYLFGFRKHEQGNNAREVFEFDPLVAAEEKKIAELRTKLAAELKEANDAK